jgi:uracil-DNA glycosylase
VARALKDTARVRLPVAHVPDDHPLARHRAELLGCRACPDVIPPVVTGRAVESDVFFIGQAPGVHEGRLGQPFAWTAGKRLFEWLGTIGVDEERFRSRVYMTAVIRCFPGKAKVGGGDRVPSRPEIEACARWMEREVALLRPRLVMAVGRLAIERVAGAKVGKLDEVVGPLHRGVFFGRPVEWVALPHPSGLSSWHKTEPGKTLLARALGTLAAHPSWRRLAR